MEKRLEPTSLVGLDVIQAMCKEAETSPHGAIVEVGVYKGGTAYHLAKVAESQGRKIYLYDTFTGIPYKDEIDTHRVGDFNDTSFLSVKEAIPYANVVQGIFPDSAVDMPPIAFVHLDCDQYKSIVDSVEFLRPLLVSGAKIWFDDYGCLAGATKAVQDLFGDNIRIMQGGKAMVTL